MKKLFYTTVIFFSLVLTLVFITPVFAQVGGGTGGGTGGGGNPPGGKLLENPLKPEIGGSIPALLSSLINNVIIPIGAVLCVLAFIYAGFQYVLAQGNPGKIATANKAFLYAAIGTVVLLGSWVIAKAICSTVRELGASISCPS